MLSAGALSAGDVSDRAIGGCDHGVIEVALHGSVYFHFVVDDRIEMFQVLSVLRFARGRKGNLACFLKFPIRGICVRYGLAFVNGASSRYCYYGEAVG